MAKRKRRAFTNDFKAEAVRVVRESGKTVGAVARELDLTETALRDWVRRAAVDADWARAGALTIEERTELAQLRLEERTLRMECDIPKPVGLGLGRPTCRARNSQCGHADRRPGSRGCYLIATPAACPLRQVHPIRAAC
jgi:transposase